MEIRSFIVLILSLCHEIGSTAPEPVADPSIPVVLEQKMAEMEARLAAKIESRARDVEGQMEGILRKVSEAVHGTAVVLGRLKNAERAFVTVDHHLLSEVERAHDKIILLEKEIAKKDILQVKINDTQDMLNSFIESHKESEAAIRKNITEVAGNLELFLNDSRFQKIQSNFTAKMRDLEIRIQKDYVSKMDESTRNRERAVQAQFQTLRSQLEDRCEELNETLTNHSSLIAALNEETFDIQVRLFSCDGDPPFLPNGKAMDFERKHGSKVPYECNDSYVLTSRSTVHCHRGDWEGRPPVCSYFDATFFVGFHLYGHTIQCFSAFNSQKMNFSRVLDTGWGTHLPGNARIGATSHYFHFEPSPSLDGYGSFQCGFSDERGSMNIYMQRQNMTGDLYFEDHSKVANIGDAVDLEVHFDKDRSIGWKLNGVDVPSWRNRRRVEIPSVELSDAGIYECYYEGQRGVTAPALLRLIVRSNWVRSLAIRRLFFQFLQVIVASESAVGAQLLQSKTHCISNGNLTECKKNLFGEHCDEQCPPCYNGGICHDHLGVCVCPPGFRGSNCEVACGSGQDLLNCRYHSDANLYLFCLSDPYGCSCGRGWKGMKCNEACKKGWYGADCKQPCHCALGSVHCDRVTGVCSGGCSPGWTGQSCQIQVVD